LVRQPGVVERAHEADVQIDPALGTLITPT
jgi:hypothetical protein